MEGAPAAPPLGRAGAAGASGGAEALVGLFCPAMCVCFRMCDCYPGCLLPCGRATSDSDGDSTECKCDGNLKGGDERPPLRREREREKGNSGGAERPPLWAASLLGRAAPSGTSVSARRASHPRRKRRRVTAPCRALGVAPLNRGGDGKPPADGNNGVIIAHYY